MAGTIASDMNRVDADSMSRMELLGTFLFLVLIERDKT